MMLSALLYGYKRVINRQTPPVWPYGKWKERKKCVCVGVWMHVLLWMSDLRTTAAHTAAVLNLSSTEVSCPLSGFTVFLSHICDISATLVFWGGGHIPKLRPRTDALAWLKSDQTELAWTNTLRWAEWESDYSCLCTPSCSAGFPPWTLSRSRKKKQGNRRRGRDHSGKERTWRALRESQTFLNGRGTFMTALQREPSGSFH